MKIFHENPEELMEMYPDWDIVRTLGQQQLREALRNFQGQLALWSLPDGWKRFSQNFLDERQCGGTLNLWVMAPNAIGFSPEQIEKTYKELGNIFGFSIDDADENDADEILNRIEQTFSIYGADPDTLINLALDASVPKDLSNSMQSVFDTLNVMNKSETTTDDDLVLEQVEMGRFELADIKSHQFIDTYLKRHPVKPFHLQELSTSICANGESCYAFVKLDTRNSPGRASMLNHTLAFSGIFSNGKPLVIASFTIETPSGDLTTLSEDEYLDWASQMEGRIRGLQPEEQANRVLDMLAFSPAHPTDTIHDLLCVHNGQPSKNAIIFLNDIEFPNTGVDASKALTCLFEEIVKVCEQGARHRVPIYHWTHIEHEIFMRLSSMAKQDPNLRVVRSDPLCDHVSEIIIQSPIDLIELYQGRAYAVKQNLSDRQRTKQLLLSTILSNRLPDNLDNRITHFL